MGGIVLGILVWQEGGEAVGLLIAVGAVSMVGLAWWLVHRKRAGKSPLIDPDLFAAKPFRIGISQQMMQQIALGGTMIALPIFLQMVLEYNTMEAGLTIAPLSLSMFAVALIAGKKANRYRPAHVIIAGFALLLIGLLVLEPIIAPRRLRLGSRPPADRRRIRTGPARVATQQLHAVADHGGAGERGRGVNSAAGSFGLSFGLAFAGAIMLATLSYVFTDMANDSEVLAPAQQEQVANTLEDDAEVMSNTKLEAQLAGQPAEIQDEIIRINTDARPRAMQVALLVPIAAALIGLLNAFRMARLPDPIPSGAAEGMLLD